MYTNHSIEKSDSEEESPPDGSGIPASIERPSSSVSRTSPEGEIADVLAALQRKTSALEAEMVRRQALEKDLRRRDAELDDFFENAAECLHQVGADGTIMWANKAPVASALLQCK